LIDRVPTEEISPPWDEAINSVQKSTIMLLIPGEPLRDQISINENIYLIALHWLFKKKWRSNHKIPTSRNVAKVVEPLGEFLFQLLNLCSECHLVAPSGYSNAAEMFQKAAQEMKQGDLAEILSCDQKGDGKKKYCRTTLKEIKILKSNQNPYQVSKSPHTHRLIEIALQLANQGVNDLFVTKTWKPFLSAYSGLTRELDRNPDWGYIHRKAGKLFIKEGKGRGSIRLSG